MQWIGGTAIKLMTKLRSAASPNALRIPSKYDSLRVEIVDQTNVHKSHNIHVEEFDWRKQIISSETSISVLIKL